MIKRELILCILLAILASSCDKLLNKTQDGEIKIVIVERSIFPLSISSHLNEIKPGISESGITFKVIPMYSDTLKNDTITFTREDFDHIGMDTIYIDKNYFLTLDEEITLHQLEEYLRRNNYSYSQLHEHIYWMSRISRATIQENKNRYGDIEGCWLVTPEREYIPPDYWTYRKNTSGFSNQKYSIITKRCVIAEKVAKYSSIRFVLNFDPSFEDFSSHYDEKITLSTTEYGNKYRTGKGRALKILVEMQSSIAITRYGQSWYYTDFSPFSIVHLKEASFPPPK